MYHVTHVPQRRREHFLVRVRHDTGRGERQPADGSRDSIGCCVNGVGAVEGGAEVVLTCLELPAEFAQHFALDAHGLRMARHGGLHVRSLLPV